MKKIHVIGLGAGDLTQMPLGIYRYLKQVQKLFVRTADHPAVTELVEEGMEIVSFDDVYRQFDQFEQVYEQIVQLLFEEAEKADVIYAVPGHPFVAEKTIQLLIEQAPSHDVSIHFLGGQSFLDPMYNALQIDPIEGLQIVDGTNLKRDDIQLKHHTIIVQVYDAYIASEVKLTLMERLPDDYLVTVATAVGSTNQTLVTVPLYELDQATTLNNLTAVYVPPVQDETLLREEFNQLRQIIATLRGPNGCPWDQKQTHQSLKKYLIEEAYEVLEAIDEEDDDHLVEELGDVLLQVLLHAQIGEDEGYFSIQDVIKAISDKMIRRHPHVFAEEVVRHEEEVLANWDEIKKAEKGEKDQSSFIEQGPKGLPALMRAVAIQKQAAKVGFDWNEAAPMWMKLQEEIGEFIIETKKDNQVEMSKELGDILFIMANLARFYQLDPEEALQTSTQKFINRFKEIEIELSAKGKTVEEATLEEMGRIWEKSKQKYN